MRMNIRQNNGFTLIEVLIGLLMSSIVVFSLYNITKVQQDTYVAQDQVVAMQDNLRAAMLLAVREMRMAGYDPEGNANATIITATGNTFQFTMDLDGNGVTTGSGEKITYSLYTDADGIQKLGRKSPALNRPVAEHINNIEFYYTLDDGSKALAPADPAKVRTVQLTILAQTKSADPNLTAPTSFTTPSGATWNLPAGFKGRIATMSLQCRNMGL